MDQHLRGSLLVSLLVSVIVFYVGIQVLLNLPSYNPYSFRETFDSRLDPDSWETVGSGTLNVQDGGLTLQSKTGETYALRRYLSTQSKWKPPWEVRILGVVGLEFRLNNYSNNASGYVILETDTLRLGLSGSKIIVQETRSGRSTALVGFVAGNWYQVEIKYAENAAEVYIDGAAVWNSTRPLPAGFGYRAWFAIGNLQPNAFGGNVGGSITIADLHCLCRPLPWSEEGT